MGGDKNMEITYSYKFSDLFADLSAFTSAVTSSMVGLTGGIAFSSNYIGLVYNILKQNYNDDYVVYDDKPKAINRIMSTFQEVSPPIQKLWLVTYPKLLEAYNESNFQKVEEMTNDITRDINRSTTVDRDTEANEFTKQADTPTIKDSSDDFVDDYANMMRKGNVGTQEDSVTALAETSGEDTVNVKVGSLAVLFEIYNRIPADLYIKIIRPYAKHFQLFYD
jgi:hypothetical protein